MIAHAAVSFVRLQPFDCRTANMQQENLRWASVLIVSLLKTAAVGSTPDCRESASGLGRDD